MKRLWSFIYKVIVFKLLKAYSPSLSMVGIDPSKQSLKWYLMQSKNATNAWRHYE